MSNVRLNVLLNLEIPISKPKERGFLELVGQSTKENPISNVYRNFLDRELSPELSKLLIDALKTLIEQKLANRRQNLDLELDEFEVIREFHTGQGRIDLVIESKKGQSVIIIESKIYHTIKNDLNDYWKAFEYPEEKKVGILLSLFPASSAEINHSHFINITHIEWLNQAKIIGLPFDLSPKSYIYFTDFYNTMQNLSKGNELSPEVEFYLNHFEVVEDAIKSKEAAVQFIMAQLDKVCKAMDWSVYGNADDWRNLWDEKSESHVYWTVFPLEIIQGRGQIDFLLEIDGDLRQFEGKIREKFTKQWEELGFKSETNKEKYVVHLAWKEYPFNSRKIANVADEMIEWLKKDLEPLRKEIEEYAKTLK